MRFSKEALLAVVAAGAVGFVGSAQAATILTGTGLGNNLVVPAAHGSNAAGTPNVVLAWDADWDAYNSWPNDAGNGVYQHDNKAGTPHTVIFTPDAGFNVSITSFIANDWSGGGGDTVFDWSVVGSVSGAIASGTGVTVPDGTTPTIAIGAAGTGNETLTLSIDQTAGKASFFAIDDLAFDQTTVPEPGTAILALGGIGALAMRRKRK